MLGVANDIGENVGLIPGLVCNKFPPWVVLLIGSFSCFFGYGVLWLSLCQTVQHLPYWLLWIVLCVATNSSAWFSTTVLVTNMRNFPLSRGTVAGILKGYGGLSAAVYTEAYSARPFYVSYTFLVIMVVLLMAPLAIPVKMTFYPSNKGKMGVSDVSEKSEPLLTPSSSATNLGSFQEGDEISEVDMLLAEGEGVVKKKRRPRRGEDFKFTEALVKADFWLLFLVYFFGVGSGVTVLNNLAQIGIAQGLHDTKILLSLFSYCNFVGRLGGGVLSEYFVRLKALPRTVWMTCTQVVMIITYLLFASALNGTLYAATALLGICYGVQFTTMVPTASELFCLKHFGAYLFSGLLAGFLYDNEAAKQHTSTCLGPNCFRVIVLTMRIKPVYQMLYAGGSFRLPQSSNH
ncbi:hypothetical protein K7X08_028184 [Anisodus acutangulus]|uniref:Nodulin-like domain-containing protein n=1 Tax=Anisodus acutangulus TaxID=402998 RepID=A0A9Q1RS21_9SOLA|nr:hypothetical protein K7X08_028184 [Anisodus acutangulus]